MNKKLGLFELDFKGKRIFFHRDIGQIALVKPDQNTLETSQNFFNMIDGEPRIEVFQGHEYGKGKITLSYMSARTCNMGCRYCFADQGEYGRDECKSRFFTKEMYLKGFLKALEIYPEGVERIDFFGGEPLLNYKAISGVVPEILKICREKNLPRPVFSMTTNGTLINEEIANFLKEYRFRFSISLDGPARINNQARVFKTDSLNAYATVKNAMELLKKNNISYSISATINSSHLKDYKEGGFAEIAKDFEKLGFENISFVPAVTNVKDLSVSSREMLDKLDIFTRDLINYYYDKIENGDLEMIPSLLVAPILQVAKRRYSRDCSAGKSFLWDTDGRAYPCQMFCNDDKYCLGDMNNGLDEKAINSFLEYKREECEACRNCISKNLCFAWCKGLQYIVHGDVYKICEERCVFQKAIVEESIIRLVDVNECPERRKKFWKNYKNYQEKAAKRQKYYEEG